MGGNATAHAFVIGLGMTALVKTDDDINEVSGPADEERAHEPVTELEDVIDLVAVLGGVRRLTEQFVDQREAMHTARDLLPLVAREVRVASAHDAKGEN